VYFSTIRMICLGRGKIGSGEPVMNRNDVHQIHENRALYEEPYPRASSRYGGLGVCLFVFSHWSTVREHSQGRRHRSSYFLNKKITLQKCSITS
jgi:hypothetical protein